MKEVLLERKGMDKQRGRVWLGRGGGFSIMATPLSDIPGVSEVSNTIVNKQQ